MRASAIYGAVEDVSLDDARYQFEVNLFGLARLTQLCYCRECENKGAGNRDFALKQRFKAFWNFFTGCRVKRAC